MTASVLFLVDESDEMTKTVAHAAGAVGKSKAESVATALNALFNRLRHYPQLNVALVGYRGDADGKADVGCRWAGNLAGCEWVSVEQLGNSAIRVDKRTSKAANGVEETRDFRIWYEPELNGKGPQIAAFQFCRRLLESSGQSSGPPIIVHITSGSSGDGNPHGVIKEIQGLTVNGEPPVVLQAHLASHIGKGALTPTVFPANRAFLPAGPTRDFFDRTSPLPEHFAIALREAGVNLNNKARGMVYNAKMLELSRLLSLVEAHAGKWVERLETIAEEKSEDKPKVKPPAVEEPTQEQAEVPKSDATSLADADAAFETEQGADDSTAKSRERAENVALADISVSPEAPALVLFVIDRSVSDPFGGNMDNTCAQLMDSAAEIVSSISKFGGGSIDTGIVTYGLDAADEVDVRSTLEGGLAGSTIVRDDQITSETAVRVAETVEEVPNGAGGLNKIPHRYVHLVEVEPSRQAPAAAAFARAAELVSQWYDGNSSSKMPAIVLHLTRGLAEDLPQAADHLRNSLGHERGVLIYHLVRTEDDHRSLKYPADPSQLGSAELQQIWEETSRLLGRHELSPSRDYLSEDSRGMVVNAGFELLLHPNRICSGQLEL